MSKDNDEVPARVWIPALVFTTLLISQLIIVFFVVPQLTWDQSQIMRWIFALLGGFSTHFLGGTALLQFTSMREGSSLSFSAVSGIAVFVLLAFFLPNPFNVQVPTVHFAPNSPLSRLKDLVSEKSEAQLQLLWGTPGSRLEIETSIGRIAYRGTREFSGSADSAIGQFCRSTYDGFDFEPSIACLVCYVRGSGDERVEIGGANSEEEAASLVRTAREVYVGLRAGYTIEPEGNSDYYRCSALTAGI